MRAPAPPSARPAVPGRLRGTAPQRTLEQGRVRAVVLTVNTAGAVAAAVFAGAGLARPGYVRLGSSPDPTTRFWAASSAVRTWAVTGPLLAGIVRGGRPAPSLLAVAGLVQLGDAALGVWQRNPRMAVLPAAMGLVHLGSARLLDR